MGWAGSQFAADNKLWIATASADGSAHLVPFSFVWDGVVRERFMAMVDEGRRVTGASRVVVLEQLARGLLFSVTVALDLPDDTHARCSAWA